MKNIRNHKNSFRVLLGVLLAGSLSVGTFASVYTSYLSMTEPVTEPQFHSDEVYADPVFSSGQPADFLPVTDGMTVPAEVRERTEYTYDDELLSARAVLSSAELIPDDAQLMVTRIMPESEYDIDAYLRALNTWLREKAAEGVAVPAYTADNVILSESVPEGVTVPAYTADNVILYDIHFEKDGASLPEIYFDINNLGLFDPSKQTPEEQAALTLQDPSLVFDTTRNLPVSLYFYGDQIGGELGVEPTDELEILQLPSGDQTTAIKLTDPIPPEILADPVALAEYVRPILVAPVLDTFIDRTVYPSSASFTTGGSTVIAIFKKPATETGALLPAAETAGGSVPGEGTGTEATFAEPDPAGFITGDVLPEGTVPGEQMPAETVPEGQDPAVYIPEGTDPSVYVPEGGDPAVYIPEGVDPSALLPEGADPAVYLPEGTDPAAYIPEGTDPSVHVPEGADPAALLPEGQDPAAALPVEQLPAGIISDGQEGGDFLPGIPEENGEQQTGTGEEGVLFSEISGEEGTDAVSPEGAADDGSVPGENEAVSPEDGAILLSDSGETVPEGDGSGDAGSQSGEAAAPSGDAEGVSVTISEHTDGTPAQETSPGSGDVLFTDADTDVVKAGRVYSYQDDRVYVTATLLADGAVPADAEFIVTPITSSTSGYNYDAYMEALNAQSDGAAIDVDAEGKYNDSNTLLYDVAFYVDELDEEGNPTGRKKEFQPAEGTVQVSIVYADQVNEDGTGQGNQEEARDSELLHLTLSEEIMDEAGVTRNATDISANDIVIETVTE